MSETLNLRRTALLLHAMSAADRHWMLARLDAESQASLRSMLDELVALGIPADKALLSRAAETAAPLHQAAASMAIPAEMTPVNAAGTREAEPPASAITSLNDVNPTTLAQILQDEPPELIARLLACHAWQWREGLLEQLGQARHSQVERFAHSFSDTPPRLRAVLLQSLVTRLSFAPALNQAPGSSRIKSSRAGVVRFSWMKKIGTAFKQHRQFSRLKRGAR
ncbi:MAG: hypothetical protein ABI171_14990 [Collimonas sp.]|uniref:hypothetical protein n=1 Tax=Collimonas sp. TaxID=1963772 RepID=UPI003266F455